MIQIEDSKQSRKVVSRQCVIYTHDIYIYIYIAYCLLVVIQERMHAQARMECVEICGFVRLAT